MAILTGSYLSQSIGIRTTFCAVLPNDRAVRPAEGFPALYLFHGQSGDYTSWICGSSIERYAIERGIAVIMPEVQLSYYTDKKYGLNYFSYVSDELPRVGREMFGLSPKRGDTFVAGLSMGGYGALKCVLTRPDVFSAGAALSGVVNMQNLVKGARVDNLVMEHEILGVLGDPPVVKDEDDLFKLADKAAALPLEKRPRVMTCCGTSDGLYQDNLAFKKHMESTGLDYHYDEGPGIHDWDFWSKWIVDVLDFFEEPGKK